MKRITKSVKCSCCKSTFSYYSYGRPYWFDPITGDSGGTYLFMCNNRKCQSYLSFDDDKRFRENYIITKTQRLVRYK